MFKTTSGIYDYTVQAKKKGKLYIYKVLYDDEMKSASNAQCNLIINVTESFYKNHFLNDDCQYKWLLMIDNKNVLFCWRDTNTRYWTCWMGWTGIIVGRPTIKTSVWQIIHFLESTSLEVKYLFTSLNTFFVPN